MSTAALGIGADVPVLPGFPSLPGNTTGPADSLPTGDAGIGGVTVTPTTTTPSASTASSYVAPALALGKWVIAVVIYLAAISFLTPKQAAGLSLVLILGALLVAQQQGHDIFKTLGIE